MTLFKREKVLARLSRKRGGNIEYFEQAPQQRSQIVRDSSTTRREKELFHAFNYAVKNLNTVYNNGNGSHASIGVHLRNVIKYASDIMDHRIDKGLHKNPNDKTSWNGEKVNPDRSLGEYTWQRCGEQFLKDNLWNNS